MSIRKAALSRFTAATRAHQRTQAFIEANRLGKARRLCTESERIKKPASTPSVSFRTPAHDAQCETVEIKKLDNVQECGDLKGGETRREPGKARRH